MLWWYNYTGIYTDSVGGTFGKGCHSPFTLAFLNAFLWSHFAHASKHCLLTDGLQRADCLALITIFKWLTLDGICTVRCLEKMPSTEQNSRIVKNGVSLQIVCS